MKFAKDNNFKPPKSKKTKLIPINKPLWEQERKSIYWMSLRGALLIEEMDTAHIKNCLNRIELWERGKTWGERNKTQWKKIFNKELAYRKLKENNEN